MPQNQIKTVQHFFHDICRYFICFHSSIFNNDDVYTYVNVINKYRWYFYLENLEGGGAQHGPGIKILKLNIWLFSKKC